LSPLKYGLVTILEPASGRQYIVRITIQVSMNDSNSGYIQNHADGAVNNIRSFNLDINDIDVALRVKVSGNERSFT